MHNFFIWLKVCCIPPSPNVGGSEKSRLWVSIGGSEKNRLWCVANGMSGKRHNSKCSKWPPSERIDASSLFRRWSTASSTTLWWNSAHVAMFSQLVRIADWYSIRVKNEQRWKNCACYKVVRWYLSGVVGKRIKFVFFWDNVNNLKYVWIILLKNDFFGFPR